MKLRAKITRLINQSYYMLQYKAWRQSIRLEQAINIAEKLHELNNGTRYFVLEVDYKPGYYQVRSWSEIKAEQKLGRFSTRANFIDFLREAKYYTRAGVRPGEKYKARKNYAFTKFIVFASWVTIILFLLALVVMKKFDLLN